MDQVLNEKFVSEDELSDDEPRQLRPITLEGKMKSHPAEADDSSSDGDDGEIKERSHRRRHRSRSSSVGRDKSQSPRRRNRSPPKRSRSPRGRSKSPPPRRRQRSPPRRHHDHRRRDERRSRSRGRRRSPRRPTLQVLLCYSEDYSEEMNMKRELKRLGYTLYDHLEPCRNAARYLIHQEKHSKLAQPKKEAWVEPLARHLAPTAADFMKDWGEGLYMELFREWSQKILRGHKVAMFGLNPDLSQQFIDRGAFLIRGIRDLRLTHHATDFVF